ncbi:phosphoglucosamine mutase [Enterobacter cancerogenus]|uniref:Phosphoglucosamine mutase n=1 Tax=Enterobacter cancerogenus TaxID=69218 RepID=A0A484WBQ1_9ENTR|nr:phosphoglucosamine mutase [Enterobacter cancerogenus]
MPLVAILEFCKGTFPNELSLAHLKIVVDCANGATYHIAPNVFRELGAKVITIGCEPDGLNINEEVGATDVRALQARVLAEKADLGIALDGDGDRVIMVDHEGNKVDGDQILYIIAREGLRQGQLRGGAVGTLMSNMGLELALKQLGIPFVRAKVGGPLRAGETAGERLAHWRRKLRSRDPARQNHHR